MIPGSVLNASPSAPAGGPDRPDHRCGARSEAVRAPAVADSAADADVHLEVSLAIVQYQVRAARITDVDRIVDMLDAAVGRSLDGWSASRSADLLRQLVGLPHAVVIVAESGRRVAGAGIMALRPSVTLGGLVGSVDALLVDPAATPSPVRETLLEELLRSARNKGCVAVEGTTPSDPAERARWVEQGFVEADTRMVRDLASAGARPA